MVRKISLVMGCLVLLAGVTFASGSQESQAESAAADSAEPQQLVVWSHAVHQQVTEGTRGGAAKNLTTEFERQYGVDVVWNTIPWGGMQEKVLRQLTQPDGEADIVFLVNGWASPTALGMFEPLSSYRDRSPIDNFSDIAQGMVETFTHDGSVRLLPYRSNPQILHYNAVILQERGVDGPPENMEQWMEAAKSASYTRDDGAEVYGLGIKPSEDPIAIIRAFGGEVLSSDYTIGTTSREAIRAVEWLKELYEAGAIPPNFSQLGSQEYQNLMNEGLVAMTLFGDNYQERFNDPEQSRVAGNVKPAAIPAAGGGVAQAKIAYWGAGIPTNSDSDKKDLAWEFLKFFTSQEIQFEMALNGNGPVRTSVFEMDAYVEQVPYASTVAKMLDNASPHIPVFEGTTEVLDVFEQQVVLAITGRKEVAQAMADAESRIQRVLDQEGIE